MNKFLSAYVLFSVLLNGCAPPPRKPSHDAQLTAAFRRIDQLLEEYKRRRGVWEVCVGISAGRFALTSSEAAGDLAVLALAECRVRELETGAVTQELDPTGQMLTQAREDMRAEAIRYVLLQRAARRAPVPRPPPRT